MIRVLSAVALMMLLASCSGRPGAQDELLGPRDFELQEFFEGPVVAHGQFQDRFGTVRRRFKVAMQGDWNPQTRRLRLTEDFTYADGSTETRVWTLRQTGPESWVGRAPGVIGEARGVERGDTFNWTYTIDLPLPEGKTRRVSFDDWMWQVDEDRVLNRAYMRKYGVTFGSVIIMFEKQR